MISVTSALAAQAIIERVGAAVRGEIPAMIREFERELPREQQAWWARRFNRGWKHTKLTVEERAKGLGNPVREAKKRRARASGIDATYYDRNRPNRGAAPDEPYYFWTGRMLESTTRYTKFDPNALTARIDTGANYRGPLTREGFSDPVEEIMVRGAKPVEPWDVGRLNAVMEDKVAAGLKRVAERMHA